MRVLITGGNKGIGLAATKLFLEKGDEVTALGKNFDNFPLNDNKHIQKITFDLQDIEKISSLASIVGDIDILINNAGIMNTLAYNTYPEDKKQMILKINLEAPVELIKIFSEGMLKRRKGRIVNVASIAGQIGHPDIWYGITKAGIIN